MNRPSTSGKFHDRQRDGSRAAKCCREQKSLHPLGMWRGQRVRDHRAQPKTYRRQPHACNGQRKADDNRQAGDYLGPLSQDARVDTRCSAFPFAHSVIDAPLGFSRPALQRVPELVIFVLADLAFGEERVQLLERSNGIVLHYRPLFSTPSGLSSFAAIILAAWAAVISPLDSRARILCLHVSSSRNCVYRSMMPSSLPRMAV